MKLNKSIKVLLKLALVMCFYFGLYLLSENHFQKLEELSWESLDFGFLPMAGAFALMPLNWYLESLKWRVSLRPVENISVSRAILGVLKGIPPSLFTPNRVGEAIGRPSVLQRQNRISGGLATAYCGLSQMPVMMFLGVLACIFFSYSDVEFASSTFLTSWWFVSIGFMGTLMLVLFFLFPKYSIPFVRNSDKSHGLRKRLQFFCNYTLSEKTTLLALSFLRYVVYSSQYYLVITSTGIQIDFLHGMMSVFLIYTLMSFVPRPALAELGVRCSITVLILKEYSSDYTLPTISSILLWGINLLIPALCGTVFYIIQKKDKKNS